MSIYHRKKIGSLTFRTLLSFVGTNFVFHFPTDAAPHFLQKLTLSSIECFHMTSRLPYWCPKPVLWELSSFLMQTLSFVPINLHRCWPRDGKIYILSQSSRDVFYEQHKLLVFFFMHLQLVSLCARRSAKQLLDGRVYHLLKASYPHVGQMGNTMLSSVTRPLVFAGVWTRMEQKSKAQGPTEFQVVDLRVGSSGRMGIHC